MANPKKKDWRSLPRKADADRVSEAFTMRLTASQKAFLKRQAAQRKTTVNALIRTAIGFLERAAAERDRHQDLMREWRWS